MKPEKLKELLDIINSKLPSGGKILCLSLTGSQAFGWANENFDYDMHGLFTAKSSWSWVHDGRGVFDINLYSLEYILTHLPDYLGFEFFQNISNPVYLDANFDYRGLMSLCSPNSCYEPTDEIMRLKNHFAPRAVLHCYRVLMVPIHFLQTRTFELDIFKLNKKYNFKMLLVMKEAYWDIVFKNQNRKVEEFEKEIILQDLDKLLIEFRKLKEKTKDEKIAPEKIEKWKSGISQTWEIELEQKIEPKIEQGQKEKKSGFLNFLISFLKKLFTGLKY